MEPIQERIATLISTKGMTNAEFADAVGVQPSNISHIMSGRNKPSLDLVTKILRRFPEVRPEWILNGKGSMTKEFNLFGYEEEDTPPQKKEAKAKAEQAESTRGEMAARISQASGDKFQEKESKAPVKEPAKAEVKFSEEVVEKSGNTDPRKTSGKTIEKIVIFYRDRSFREYHPEG